MVNNESNTNVARSLAEEAALKKELEADIIRNINRNIVLDDIISRVKHPTVHERKSLNISQLIDPNIVNRQQSVEIKDYKLMSVETLDYNITAENYKDIKTYAESKRNLCCSGY